MSEYASLRVEDAAFGRNDLPATRNHAPFGAHAPGVWPDRAGEIGFGLDGRITHAGWEERVSRDPRDGVDQRQRPAAVNGAQRVEKLRLGLTFKHAKAVADFDDPEVQGLRNRRRRDFAVDHGLQHSRPVIPATSAGFAIP